MSKAVVLRGVRIICLLPILGGVAIGTLIAGAVSYDHAGFAAACFVVVFGVVLAIFIGRWGVSDQAKLFDMIGLLASLVVGIALLLPAIQSPRGPHHRMECSNRLKQVAFAIHHYHDTYKTFPPAYISDFHGPALHSWRVLLMPFVEQQSLSANYDFNSAWNHETNLPLADICPATYRCPMSDAPASDTNHLAVVGGETVWPGNGPTEFRDIIDGSSNTIVIVESHESRIKWTEPRDLTFDTMEWQINGEAPLSQISSKHPGGVNVALADGSVRFISETMDPEFLRALITAQGGEAIDGNDW
ncbi:MAG: DUF1559 domain-containing protein [Planctomycetes bacterium]|nr:DUF1559 domain-containing protein [Planctomycetota bacterium]